MKTGLGEFYLNVCMHASLASGWLDSLHSDLVGIQEFMHIQALDGPQ
jgi:hypothetical protein